MFLLLFFMTFFITFMTLTSNKKLTSDIILVYYLRLGKTRKTVDTLTALVDPVPYTRLTSLYMSGKLFKSSLRCRKNLTLELNWRGMGEQGTSVKKNAQNLFSYFFILPVKNGIHTNGIN